MNSLKMKMAVIFGVAQMSLGIILKGTNAIHNKNMIDFLFEFCPQIIILIALFGYMDFMIIIKWLTNWEGKEAHAPSVITTMIDMCLNMGKPSNAGDAPLLETWHEQTELQLTLLSLVALCVPIMLFVKPVWLAMVAPSHHKEEHVENGDDDFHQVDAPKNDKIAIAASATEDKFNIRSNIVASSGDAGHGGNHGFGEAMIHQLIETIEFVLGTVSNTASYLRLWALSLAHSQLAKVFFDNCLVAGFHSGNVIVLYLGFFVFMGATFGVLMCMDLLECSLHTLRLHWVEFQNKFFKGAGIPFAPVILEKVVIA